MKKTAAILLTLAMFLLTGLAAAEISPVARNGALSAYLDGDGHLYLPGNDRAINKASADTLISIDPYRVLFMSERSDGGSDLYMIDLGSYAESRLAQGVYSACPTDENTLYYVSADNRDQLMRMDLNSLRAVPCYTAAEPIDRLYASAEGLVFDQVDGTGTMIYVAASDSFQSYAAAIPSAGERTDAFEVCLADGALYTRTLGNLAEEPIDAGVLDYAVMDGSIYYLCNTGSAVRLKSYAPADMSWQTLLTLEPDLDRQLTATASGLYMIDSQRQIYRVNVARKALEPFQKLNAPASYGIGADYVVNDLRLEGMPGQLNVYAEVEEAGSQPNFSFIEFTSTSDSASKLYKLLVSFPIDGEDAAWTFLKPAVQYAPLARGNRGEAVRAIQQPLYDLGYYDYYVDGIFGPRTQHAVELLQMDLGRAPDGVADSELQRLILEGGLSHYDAYLALTRGNRGMRVQLMQERLRDLGYLADAADGIFGANTQRAVQLFQSENGLPVSEGATRETLKRLYSDRATQCASYINLYQGYTGIRVRELNNRLEALYYLENNPGSVYTAATTEAVRAFQRRADLTVNGEATVEVLRKLFSRYAPEAPGYITLRRGDANDRVRSLQRRLRRLGYFTTSVDGYYGSATEKAVMLFQKRAQLTPTGVATVRTQQLLFRSDAPEYVEPTVIGTPEITVKPYDYRDNGVYIITDDSSDTGYVTFNWVVEGDVDSYRVRIKDADGDTLFDEDTLLTRTGVSIATLDYDSRYTMTVTAYPEDGDANHITSASLRFMRVETPEEPEEPEEPEIGHVDAPEISFRKVTRVQDGIYYVDKGDIILQWHAEGDVDSYTVEVLDEDGEDLMSLSTTDERATIHSTAMEVGKVYTLFVYAIPTNGTLEDAETEAELFALEDISVPTPSPEPEEDDARFEPLTDVTPVPEIEEEPDPAATEVPEIEELPTEEDVPEVEELAPAGLAAPELTLSEVVETIDEVSYVAEGAVMLNWKTDGDPAFYDVTVYNSRGDIEAHTTTEKDSLGIKSSNLDPGEVYTLNVTAVPESGDVEEGATATAEFALYVKAMEDAEAPVEEAIVADDETSADALTPTIVGDVQPTEEVVPPLTDADKYAMEDDVPPSDDEDDVPQSDDEDARPIEDIDGEATDEAIASEDAVMAEEYADEGGEPDASDDLEPEANDLEPEANDFEPEAYDLESDAHDAVDDLDEVEVPAEDDAAAASDIAAVQDRLVDWGWLEADAFAPGVLDAATLQAVRDFQRAFNDVHGGELPLAQSEIDPVTLSILLNNNGERFEKE